MADDRKGRKPLHEEFAEKIIEDLKRGVAPWQKPWRPGELHAPLNPVSGTVYSGINRVMLSRKRFDDPRWMTLRQANAINCRVRKGEKSQPIVYWQFSKEEAARDDDGKPVLDVDGNQVMEKVELTRPIVRFSSVFHVSQLEGSIPPLDPSKVRLDWDPNKKAETILENSAAVIKHNQRDRAFYNPREDEICLPPLDHFPSADGYYATALHELGHWTGHETRMGREFGPFGSELYAREELRAEIASWMLGQDMGIGYDPGQHLSYVDSWIKVLEKDPYEIVRACRDAEKIKQYVLTMEKMQDLNQGVSAPAHAPEASRDPGASQEPSSGKIFLAVPFREKNLARAAGAKWDAEAKLWFAPPGADMQKLKSWLPRKEALTPAATMNPTDEFAHVLRSAGLELDGPPLMDGRIHRVPVAGRPNALDGSYKAYLDGRPAGWYQNFVTGEKTSWKAHGHTLTEEQKNALRLEAAERGRRRDQERLAEQERVARQCQKDFGERPPASSDHPYLLKKGIPPLGIKESWTGDAILVPLFDSNNTLRNVQQIYGDGTKRFQHGGQKKGCFFLIDSEKQLDQGEILLSEGYATGVSLHMATGKPVAVAFDSGNLEPVAKALRDKYPMAKITICADNDHARYQGNVGVELAKKAALTVGGNVLIPLFNREEQAKGLNDFNDLHQSRGIQEVAGQVARGLNKMRELER